MTQVLGRLYELVITNVTTAPTATGTIPAQEVPTSPFPSAVSTETRALPLKDKTKSRIWKGGGDALRLQATIDKNNTNSNTNNATIKLWNVSKEDLAFITTAVTKRYVSLRAGYKSIVDNALEDEFDALPEVFTGDIVNITSQRQGADKVTIITAKDSAASIRNVKISRNFPKGTNKRDIVKSVVGSWTGITFPSNAISNNAEFSTPSFSSSYTASGTVASVLDDLTKDENLVWHITNSAFYLINKTEPKLTRLLILKPEDVINEVTPTQNSNLNAKNPQGLNVRMFLDGAVDTDTKIRLKGFDLVDGKNVDGDYNVRIFKHSMDTRGNNWFTEMMLEAK